MYFEKTNVLRLERTSSVTVTQTSGPVFQESIPKDSVFQESGATRIKARPKAKAPARLYHISRQSVVTIDSKDYYLGKHDSPESIARYAVLISIYQAGGPRLPESFYIASLDVQAAFLMGAVELPAKQANQPLLVRHVTASYREHFKAKYASNKKELHRLGLVCDEIDEHEGDKLANSFGPLALQRQRQRWIDGGNSRVYCNCLTNAVVRMVKNAVSQELVKQ